MLAAATAALRQLGTKAAAEREAVLQQLAVLADAEAGQQGRESAAAAAAAIASDGELLEAAAQAVHPSARPSEPAVEASAFCNWIRNAFVDLSCCGPAAFHCVGCT